MCIESTRCNKYHRIIDADPIYIEWKKPILIYLHISAAKEMEKLLKAITSGKRS